MSNAIKKISIPESRLKNIIITLVKPQLGENIGMVARSMANFGLNNLRLVSPRDGWPNKNAWPASAGATSLLNSAQCFNALQDACYDCQYVLATSARFQRKLKLNIISLDEAIKNIIEKDHNISINIVFGCEQSGLDNESLSYCHDTVSFDTELNFSSLNLSHAVLLVAYELHKATNSNNRIVTSNVANSNSIALHSEINRLSESLIFALQQTNYFRSENKIQIQKQQIISLLLKYNFQKNDIDALLGMIKSLSRK